MVVGLGANDFRRRWLFEIPFSQLPICEPVYGDATILLMGALSENNQGILLAVEGIDGAGKTTQVKLLAELLQNAGETVVVSKEPTDGEWGVKLRRSAANGRLPVDEELDLFIRDRKQHVESLILPSLNSGKIVILDRYFYSTIAYQGSRGADHHRIEGMMEFAPVPDMTFLLDAPPSLTLNRISQGRKETPNEFEKEEALLECRVIFNELANHRKEVHLIDAVREIDIVSRDIVDHLVKNALLHKRCAKQYGCEVIFCSMRAAGACRWAQLNDKLNEQLQVNGFSRSISGPN